ncbi:MAG: hypothetical protein ABFD89_29785 [Bryobacteraceae bacterium]
MKLWSLQKPELLASVREAVERHLPTLHLVLEAETVFLRGTLAVTDPESGAVLRRYQVELKFPADYPKADPIVRETGGAIPKTDTRHFNSDGSACLFLPDARFRICAKNCSIDQFVNGPVCAFFLWQAHYEITGRVPATGEWQHGVLGILQFYFEELGTDDGRVVVRFLECLAAKKVRPPHACYCGSGRKLRDCHLATVNTYRERIPRQTAQNSRERIRQAAQQPQLREAQPGQS